MSSYVLLCYSKNSSHSPHLTNVERFWAMANATAGGIDPTDKVTDHTYQKMYGMFLLPYSRGSFRKKFKMLEIGLGCNMGYGPGKSAVLWLNMFGNNGNIWMAEYDEYCVKVQKHLGRLKGLNVLVGSASNQTDLDRWVKESGGNFDAIIDDGGHHNIQIWTAFNVLFFKALAPGGLYFIEDLQVGRVFGDDNCCVMSDVIQAWIDQLLIPDSLSIQASKAQRGGYYADMSADQAQNPPVHAVRAAKMRNKYPLPKYIDWIFCQAEACVVAKKS